MTKTRMQEAELDDDMWAQVAALELRYKFEDYSMSTLWRHLSKVGWIWKGGKYWPPPPPPPALETQVEDAMDEPMSDKQVLAYLDSTRIPDVFSDLQPPNTTTTTSQLSPEQEKLCQQRRQDAIWEIFKTEILGLSSSNHPDDPRNKEEEDVVMVVPGTTTTNTTTTTTDATMSGKRQRYTRACSNPPKSSVTITDAGADLYMRRNQRRKSRNSTTTSRRTMSSAVTMSSAGGGSTTAIGTTSIGTTTTTTAQQQQQQQHPAMMSLEDCIEYIQDHQEDETTQNVEQMEESFQQYYDEWKFLLSTNQSLLFYGYGSKYNLLQHFAKEELEKDGYVLLINAYEKAVTIDGILDVLVQAFLHGRHPSTRTTYSADADKMMRFTTTTTTTSPVETSRSSPIIERASAIARALVEETHRAELYYPIYLVIHNIDGLGLRNHMAQEALTTLVDQCKMNHGTATTTSNLLRLVASVDQVDVSAFLWNDFSFWLCQETHTYRPYHHELAMLEETSKKHQHVSSLQKENQQEGIFRLLEVLKNLAPRYAEVVQILAKLQLEASVPSEKETWVDCGHLLQQCLNKCTVKSDHQLQTFLVELLDHEVVLTKLQRSAKWVHIPYSDDVLRQLSDLLPNNSSSSNK